MGLPPLSADAWTYVVGLAVVAVKIPYRAVRGHKPVLTHTKCINDLLSGTTLVPFGLMAASVFSDDWLHELLASNRLFLAIAGGIGLLFVVGELLKADGSIFNMKSDR